MANDGFEENVNPQDLAFDPYEGLDGDGDGGGQPQFESPASDDGGWESRPMYMSEEQYNSQRFSQPQRPQVQPQVQPKQDGGVDSDVVKTIVDASGVNPESVKFLTKDGQVVSRSWDELSPEERTNIAGEAVGRLNGLSGEERALIGDMRGRGMSPREYLDAVYGSGARDAAPQEGYSIDDYDDDQLFILDMFAKYGEENVSDAQVEKALADAKSDPDLWEKTMSGLRGEYMAREEELDREEEMEARRAEAAEYDSYRSDVLREIANIRSVGGFPVELSDRDMNDLANFMTARDSAGNTAFSRALDSPRNQVRAALWTMMEDRIFRELTAGFQQAYAQGLGRGQAQAQRRSSEVVRQPQGGGGGGPRGGRGGAPRVANELDVG